MDFKGLEKGYLETGLMVDNLICKRFAKLFYLGAGVGAFRRWGANELPNSSDNWTYRLVWNVAFLKYFYFFCKKILQITI
jgi:hypothetical protein